MHWGVQCVLEKSNSGFCCCTFQVVQAADSRSVFEEEDKMNNMKGQTDDTTDKNINEFYGW